MPDESRADETRNPATVLPATLDHGALERVLARAAELHAGAFDTPDGLSEQQLIEIGQEVGLSAQHLRQALAEERTRVAVPEERGLVGEFFGAAFASASRIVPGTPAAVLATLDQWMQREEALRPKRRFTDRVTWEARKGLIDSLQVGLNLSGRAYGLTSANEVGATVSAVDATRVVVRIDASFAASRRSAVAWSAGVLGTGVASSAVLLGLVANFWGGSLLIAGAGAGIWTGVGAMSALAVSRAQRRRVARAQLALEQILDRLEHDELRKPGNPLVELFSSISR
jgi:hypothetical protein